MSEYKIDQNIPLPSRRGKYPWATLEVGDSFFVPGIKTAAFSARPRAQGPLGGRKYTSRNVDGGIHVWRIK